MKISFILLFSLSLWGQALRPGYASLSKRIHHTEFQARLRPDTHIVETYMVLNWTNTTGTVIQSIPFHLYLNAFANMNTIFMKETDGGRLRGDQRASDDEAGFGYCEVIQIKDESGTSMMDLWQVKDDLATLVLPTPLQPEETLKLQFFFESKLPRVFARSGYAGTFHLIGQWFPKPGVFINGEWNCWDYHAHSEFFADFGTYDALLTVPEEYLVGATGVLVDEKAVVDEETGQNLTTYHFVAEDVHDFAWTADSNFELARRDCDGIDIRLLHQRDLSDEGVEDQLKSAEATFSWFQEHVGPYPFSSMTIVQPPSDGSGDGAGGMEYPTLVTAISFVEPNPFFSIGPIVTIHEIGHNYWQGMLASNEFEEPWMDEGINSYTEARIFTESYGAATMVRLVKEMGVTPIMKNRLGYLGCPDRDPMVRMSWEFMNGKSYNTNSYARPAITLLCAQRLFGVETMDRLLKEYYAAWSFKHPNTEDFLAIAAGVSPELESFLRANLYGNDTVDLQVRNFRSIHTSEGGFSFEDHGEIGAFNAIQGSEDYLNQVVLFRKGKLIPPPVEVLLIYGDGTQERRTWKPGERAWDRWEWRSNERLQTVYIDPEMKLLLDVDFTNNIKKRVPGGTSRIQLAFSSTITFILKALLPF
jgi:hypothetical protein